MTQTERVLLASRRFNGVCQADFLGDTPDGGPNITRVAARLQDLEDRGYTFERIGWRNKCRVYRLIADPAPERGTHSEYATEKALPEGPLGVPLGSEEPERLFKTPTNSHWRGSGA